MSATARFYDIINRRQAESLKNRFVAASLHMIEATGELVNLPKALRNSKNGLQFSRAMMGYQTAMAIVAADEMDLFSFLFKPRDLKSIAEHCELAEPATQVLLDAVMDGGLVSQQRANGSTTYKLTTLARKELLSPRWTSGKGLVGFVKGSWKYWQDLPQVLKKNDGHPDMKVYNPDNPLMGEYIRLQTAMVSGPAKELVSKLDLSNVKNMICGTVGTSFASAVIKANPRVKLTVSCLPLLIEKLPEALEQWGLNEPEEIISNTGDALADNWGKQEQYELVFLARKFAFFDPQHGIDYLKKSMQVLPSGGWVIIWEPFADNYDIVPWMKSNIALVDAMLGEPWPLWRSDQVAKFARQAGYKVNIVDTQHGTMKFVVAQVP